MISTTRTSVAFYRFYGALAGRAFVRRAKAFTWRHLRGRRGAKLRLVNDIRVASQTNLVYR